MQRKIEAIIIVLIYLVFSLVTLKYNNIISFVILCIIFISFYLGNKLYRTLINPINIFIIGWILPLYINNFKLSFLQVDFSTKTWVIIFYTIGIHILISIIYGFKSSNIQNLEYEIKKSKYVVNLLNLFLLINLVGFSLNWIIIGGIPLIKGEHEISHLNFARFVSYLTFFYPITSSLPIILYKSGIKINKLLLVITLLFPYIVSILQMARGIMLVAAYYQIMTYVFMLKQTNEKVLKMNFKTLFITFLIVTIIAFCGEYLGTKRAKDMAGFYELEKNYWSKTVVKFKYDSEWLAYAYSYYTMGFDQLNLLLENYQGPFLGGYTLLFPLIGPTQIKNFWPIKKDEIYQNIPVIWNDAVGTFIQDIYLDVGYFPSFIIIFLLAYLENYLYYLYRKNIHYFYPFIVFSYGVFFMFFSERFFDITVLLNMILGYIIMKKIFVIR